GVLALAAGLIGGVVVLTQNQNHSTTCYDSAPQDCANQSSSSSSSSLAEYIAFSAIGGIGLGLIFAGTHANRKGHELSREAAERFVSQYNRALLREVLRRADSTPPRAGAASVSP